MFKYGMLAVGLLMTGLSAQAAPGDGQCRYDQLDLSDEQRVQIRQVVEANREQMRQLHRQMRSQVEALLTEEQKAQFKAQQPPAGEGNAQAGEKPRAGNMMRDPDKMMGQGRRGGCHWMRWDDKNEE